MKARTKTTLATPYRLEKMNHKEQKSPFCPCESGKSYQDCCQPFLDRRKPAPTAVALMRSRYTAFVLQDEIYLRYSWHPDFCPAEIRLHPDTTWLDLKIKNTIAGETGDANGQVEFVARSKNAGKASRLHEISHFLRYEDRWVYTDGEISAKKTN